MEYVPNMECCGIRNLDPQVKDATYLYYNEKLSGDSNSEYTTGNV